MCRILINTDQLAETASLLASTAGEYQAIGTQVAHCDCGCMPADVAAVVDVVTADVRSGLAGVAGGLSEQAAELAWRSGVDQAASVNGNGQIVTIGGGFYSPVTRNVPIEPTTVTIGGGFYTPVAVGSGGGSQTVTIGDSFYNPVVGNEYGETQTVTIGSGFYSPVALDPIPIEGQTVTLTTPSSRVVIAPESQWFDTALASLILGYQPVMPLGAPLPEVKWYSIVSI